MFQEKKALIQHNINNLQTFHVGVYIRKSVALIPIPASGPSNQVIFKSFYWFFRDGRGLICRGKDVGFAQKVNELRSAYGSRRLLAEQALQQLLPHLLDGFFELLDALGDEDSRLHDGFENGVVNFFKNDG